MTNQTQQTDDDKKKQQISARTTGPEGQGLNVEVVTAGKEKGTELESPLERAIEKQVEKQKERESKPQKAEPQIKQQKLKPIKKIDLKSPKVYGYRIPPKAIQNIQYLPKLSKTADPKTGIGALYIFLDRLFRMKNA